MHEPTSPPHASASQADALATPSPIASGTTDAGAETCGGEVRVLHVDHYATTARVQVGDRVYTWTLDEQDGAVFVNWLETPESEHADVDDALLCELLTDWWIAERKAEAA